MVGIDRLKLVRNAQRSVPILLAAIGIGAQRQQRRHQSLVKFDTE